MSMTNPPNRIEVVTSVQRRRRWTASEKVRMVEETFAPGMTVSLVARQHGVAPNQLFTWRRLVAQGSLTAAGSGEEVVPASDYRALQNQVRELHRLLGKKTLEAEISRRLWNMPRAHSGEYKLNKQKLGPRRRVNRSRVCRSHEHRPTDTVLIDAFWPPYMTRSLIISCTVNCLAIRRKSAATNAQNARRNEPGDETCGDRRNRHGGIFVQCRVIVLEHGH